MFAGDDDVDVMPAAQAMIKHGEQTVRIRRQINAHDVGLLVDDVIKETGVLMREPVVILLPDVRGEQIIQRRDFSPPGQFRRDLQPFGVLAEHRVHDADERLVAVEQSVPPGQQITFQPAFALVFA